MTFQDEVYSHKKYQILELMETTVDNINVLYYFRISFAIDVISGYQEKIEGVFLRRYLLSYYTINTVIFISSVDDDRNLRLSW